MPKKKITAEVVEDTFPQTDLESAEDAASQTDTVEASTPAEKPKKATQKKTTTKAKKSATKKPKADTSDAENKPLDAVETISDKSKTNFPPKEEKLGVAEKRRNKEHILSIGDERSVKTEAERYNEAIIDIRESLQNGKILTDTIDGIEEHRINGMGKVTVGVLNHGDIKVCIRLEDAVIPPRRTRGVESVEGHQYMLTKRLGAEIDYVVVGLDNENNIAVGNRLKAMEAKRKQYYFKEDRDGNKLIYPDAVAEARVVAVIQKGIFVEIFGAETFIPLEELSYQRMFNAEDYYTVGNRVLVRIQNITYDTENHEVAVKASVKRAEENPAIKAVKNLQMGQRYVGTVTQVDVEGVFVRLNSGIDVKCKFPARGRPVRGSKVTVVISWVDTETCRAWGGIIAMSSAL